MGPRNSLVSWVMYQLQLCLSTFYAKPILSRVQGRREHGQAWEASAMELLSASFPHCKATVVSLSSQHSPSLMPWLQLRSHHSLFLGAVLPSSYEQHKQWNKVAVNVVLHFKPPAMIDTLPCWGNWSITGLKLKLVGIVWPTSSCSFNSCGVIILM